MCFLLMRHTSIFFRFFAYVFHQKMKKRQDLFLQCKDEKIKL